jgi:hypothetical protein
MSIQEGTTDTRKAIWKELAAAVRKHGPLALSWLSGVDGVHHYGVVERWDEDEDHVILVHIFHWEHVGRGLRHARNEWKCELHTWNADDMENDREWARFEEILVEIETECPKIRDEIDSLT